TLCFMLRTIALALRVVMLRAIALALRVFMLRAIALALRVFLLFVLSGWPAYKQSAAARCVLRAFWRIRSGHRNLVDGGRRPRMPPVVKARLCRLPDRFDKR